jgi:hypothetical protein
MISTPAKSSATAAIGAALEPPPVTASAAAVVVVVVLSGVVVVVVVVVVVLVVLVVDVVEVVPATDAVEELFAGFGSAIADVMVAVLSRLPEKPDATFTVRVKLADAALARTAHVAVTVPVPPTAGVVNTAAGPVFCARDTNVTPVGSVSESTTLMATPGPLLVAVSVKLTFEPGETEAGPVLMIERSAGRFPAAAGALPRSTTTTIPPTTPRSVRFRHMNSPPPPGRPAPQPRPTRPCRVRRVHGEVDRALRTRCDEGAGPPLLVGSESLETRASHSTPRRWEGPVDREYVGVDFHRRRSVIARVKLGGRAPVAPERRHR